MSLANRAEHAFRNLLPSPLTLALALTAITFGLCWVFNNNNLGPTELAQHWEKGLWNAPLLAFSVQMMLMLVLGHALALSVPVHALINHLAQRCHTNTQAAMVVAGTTMAMSLLNWGLGLVFGALLARKVGEAARQNNRSLNYPLVGAAAYAGMMVWHGGLSGSAPLKVAEAGHLRSLVQSSDVSMQLPEFISLEMTTFSLLNLASTAVVLSTILVLFYILSKRNALPAPLPDFSAQPANEKPSILLAERFDSSIWPGRVVGLLLISWAVFSGIKGAHTSGLAFITPNYINLNLLGLAFIFHGSLSRFLSAIDSAIGGAAGILIQFPLYFGIMGLITGSGLLGQISTWATEAASATSLPIFTFVTAAVVNVFVPSGGGQWAVQGPIIIEAALRTGADLPKCIMAMAYGDQLTNMLQPFWALPLLGITGLRAKDILPYSLLVMAVGLIVFGIALVV